MIGEFCYFAADAEKRRRRTEDSSQKTEGERKADGRWKIADWRRRTAEVSSQRSEVRRERAEDGEALRGSAQPIRPAPTRSDPIRVELAIMTAPMIPIRRLVRKRRRAGCPRSQWGRSDQIRPDPTPSRQAGTDGRQKHDSMLDDFSSKSCCRNWFCRRFREFAKRTQMMAATKIKNIVFPQENEHFDPLRLPRRTSFLRNEPK